MYVEVASVRLCACINLRYFLWHIRRDGSEAATKIRLKERIIHCKILDLSFTERIFCGANCMHVITGDLCACVCVPFVDVPRASG